MSLIPDWWSLNTLRCYPLQFTLSDLVSSVLLDLSLLCIVGIIPPCSFLPLFPWWVGEQSHGRYSETLMQCWYAVTAVEAGRGREPQGWLTETGGENTDQSLTPTWGTLDFRDLSTIVFPPAASLLFLDFFRDILSFVFHLPFCYEGWWGVLFWNLNYGSSIRHIKCLSSNCRLIWLVSEIMSILCITKTFLEWTQPQPDHWVQSSSENVELVVVVAVVFFLSTHTLWRDSQLHKNKTSLRAKSF